MGGARNASGRLVQVGHFDAPVYAAAPPGVNGVLYIVEQAGEIVVWQGGRARPQPFLDIRSRVRSGGEQGLLSMAFDPGYSTNHLFYVDYTDLNGDTRVVRYRSNGTAAIPSSAKQLLFVKDFASNHNGGQLQFGPDGWLYWGNGDGGGGGDPEHNGQNLTRPFAKIEKLNVRIAGAHWKLVAYGLRNPWRFSFDRTTGDLYIGDVGQDEWEEIDYLPHGTTKLVDFGWSHYEGNHVYYSVGAARGAGPVCTAGLRVRALGGLRSRRRVCLPGQQAAGERRSLLLRRQLLGQASGASRSSTEEQPRCARSPSPCRASRASQWTTPASSI